MLFAGIMVRSGLQSLTGGAAARPLAEVQRLAQEEMMKAISLGVGTYLSFAVSLYLAAAAGKQFLVARAVDPDLPPQPKPAAA